MQSVHAGRIGGGRERNREPLDAEDGVPVSAVTAADCTMSSAFLVPTAPRTARQLANSGSQLSDASLGVIWAWHRTSNVASTTRIAARLLQRTSDESAATTANQLICDEAQMQCEPKGSGSMAMSSCGSHRKMSDALRDWATRNAGVRNGGHP
jgi:hypothetical protein